MSADVRTPDVLAFGGARPLRGRLRVPGDKSISHRALIFAALAEGRARSRNLATGADVRATRARARPARRRPSGPTAARWWSAARASTASREPDDVLDCENSGTTMRVLAGVLAGRPFLSVLTGDASLRVAADGAGRRAAARDGCARSTAATTRRTRRSSSGAARCTGCATSLPVASAQVKTALLLAGLQADGETEVVSPAPSRDHTERMLGALGAPVTVDGLSVRVDRGCAARVRARRARRSVVGRVLRGGGRDHARLRHRDRSRCRATRRGSGSSRCWGAWAPTSSSTPTGEVCGEPVGELRVRASALHGTTIAGDEIPNVIDEIPALAVAAAFADGVTDVRDAAELVVKESNRIGTLHEELGKLGVGRRGARRRARRAGRARRGRRVRQSRRPPHRDGDGGRRATRSPAESTVHGLARGRVVVSGVRARSRARSPDRTRA